MSLTDQEIQAALGSFADFAGIPRQFDLPFFFHVNDAGNYGLKYMDPKYKGLFGVTEKDILENGLLVVKQKVYPEDLVRAIKVCDHYQDNLQRYQSISFIQRIKDKSGAYAPFFTTSKLTPIGLVSCSIQIDKVLLPHKTMDQVLHETEFIRNNIQNFAKLSPREQEVLRKVARGLSWKQIAQDFDVSYETIKTYKKRVYAKLGIRQFHELYLYAKAFDEINS